MLRLLATLERRLSTRGLAALKLTADVTLIAFAALWTCLVVFGPRITAQNVAYFVLMVLAVRLPIYALSGVGRYSWRHVAPQDILQLAGSAVAAMPLFAAVLYLPAWLGYGLLIPGLNRPSVVLLTEPAFYLLFLCGIRLLLRIYNQERSGAYHRTRVLLVGAGSAGTALGYLLEEAGHEYTVAGYLDDDPGKRGRRLRGRPVLGRVAEAARVARQTQAEFIVIAIPSLSPERLREILTALEATGLPVRTVPPLDEVMTRRANLDDLRELRMEDLLPRETVRLDRGAICGYLQGKTVLVTGGGGSIGRQLCRQVLGCGAARLLVLGRGENSVFEAVQELTESDERGEVIPVICSIRDRMSLERVFARYRPQVVFHAAAHKHVPLMEMYPAEAIRNNVLGTLNVVSLTVEWGAERLVLVSTDKAVRPVNLMGASKRLAELIVSAYGQHSGVHMVSVRFGNVLGSRGSVVPIMSRQISRRLPVTLTDPEMVRYFMTISEAVGLILQAGADGAQGDTFILKMGHPVRIHDLACDLIRMAGLTPNVDIPIRIIGRRPGEKLREELFDKLENHYLQVGEHLYVVPRQPVALEELLPALERLREAAEREDREAIVAVLEELIPDFAPAAPVSQA